MRKWWALSWSDRGLLIQAAAAVLAVHVALRLFPFRRVLRLVQRPGRRRRPSPRSVDRIVWAVAAATRRLIPEDACLRRALAGVLLLRRAGHPAELRLGVHADAGPLEAHAWVEVGGRDVLGWSARMPFRPLPALVEAR